MKHTVNILSVAAAFILGIPTIVSALVYDGFETYTLNQFPAGGKWIGAPEIRVTNSPCQYGVKSLVIPTSKTVSNVTASGEELVWTDFWTIPRLYRSETDPIPPIDPEATAQFYVNSNGLWTVISGDGQNGTNVTTLRGILGSAAGVVYPTVTENNVYYHVSVLNDYVANRWSFFVNNIPLATNLWPIASGVTSHGYFGIQNLGGYATNVCWLDEFSVTNRVPLVIGSTNFVPGTTIPQSIAFAYFGTLGDPRATATNSSTLGMAGVNLDLGNVVDDGRTYVFLGSTQPNLSGLSFNSEAVNGEFALAGLMTNNYRYFGRIITISSNGLVAVTNDNVIAIYKQVRQANRYYITGVPVLPLGGDNTLAGPAGQQLASGLALGDHLTVYRDGAAKIFDIIEGPFGNTWAGRYDPETQLTASPGDIILSAGEGVLIQTTATAANTNTIFVGTVQTNAVSFAMTPNSWNILAWPYDSGGYLGASIGGTKISDPTISGYTNGDYAVIQQANSVSPIQTRYVSPGNWRQFFNTTTGPILDTMLLQNGDGMMYHAPAASRATWTPQRQ